MKTVARIILFCFAFFIDCAKLFFVWGFLGLGTALQAITPIGGAVGGGVAGALVGCYVNAQHSLDILGCAIGGSLGGAAGALAGAAASFFGVAAGTILGEISAYCIGVTFGAALVTGLWLSGLFDRNIVFGGFVANLLPGINLIPFEWTVVTLACILKARSQEGGMVGDIAKVATVGTMLAEGNVFGAAQTGASAIATSVATENSSQSTSSETAERPERPQLHDIRPPKPAHA